MSEAGLEGHGRNNLVSCLTIQKVRKEFRRFGITKAKRNLFFGPGARTSMKSVQIQPFNFVKKGK